MEEEKTSKEIKDIIKAVSNFRKKHKGMVKVIGVVGAFNKQGETGEHTLLGYGLKEDLLSELNALKWEIDKEKKDFINW